jgi:hypothetical protein
MQPTHSSLVVISAYMVSVEKAALLLISIHKQKLLIEDGSSKSFLVFFPFLSAFTLNSV